MAEQTALAHRQAAQASLESGDRALANREYQAELAALSHGQPEGHQFAPVELHAESREVAVTDVPPGAGERMFAHMEQELGWAHEDIEQLRSDWRGDEVANLMLGQALVEDHPELVAITERYGLADHPGMLYLASLAARMLGYRYQPAGQSAPPQVPVMQQQGTTSSGINREAFRDGLRRFDDRIQRAQAEGDSRTANEVYAEQQAWIGRVQGRQPIVNGRRTA